MATVLVFSSSLSRNFHLTNRKSSLPPIRPSRTLLSSSSAIASIRFDPLSCGWKRSSISSGSRERRMVVAGAGPPSTTSLIFAFVFPLSLLVVTFFTSVRIADKLDQQYLEELAVNGEIMEEEGQDGNMPIPLEEEPAPALPRSRNRPKREA